MHYDAEEGIKVNKGLFTKRSIIGLLIILIAAGIYASLCFFAPDIIKPSVGQKADIDFTAVNENPGSDNYLRIPTIGVEVRVSEKNTGGTIYIDNNNSDNGITLIANHKMVGITPWETLRLSPLFNIGNVKVDDVLYLDMNGERKAYKVTGVNQDTSGADLTIKTVDGSETRNQIFAKDIGKVVIK